MLIVHTDASFNPTTGRISTGLCVAQNSQPSNRTIAEGSALFEELPVLDINQAELLSVLQGVQWVQDHRPDAPFVLYNDNRGVIDAVKNSRYGGSDVQGELVDTIQDALYELDGALAWTDRKNNKRADTLADRTGRFCPNRREWVEDLIGEYLPPAVSLTNFTSLSDEQRRKVRTYNASRYYEVKCRIEARKLGVELSEEEYRRFSGLVTGQKPGSTPYYYRSIGSIRRHGCRRSLHCFFVPERSMQIVLSYGNDKGAGKYLINAVQATMTSEFDPPTTEDFVIEDEQVKPAAERPHVLSDVT